MVINTWSNFSKDKNSTKQPTNGTTYNMTLKEDTSLINPTFIFNYNGVPTFNYCQYNLIYYFVDDIIQRNKNIYEIKCSIDVLASYRADILASTQFVTRSASDYNSALYDNVFEPVLQPIISMTTALSPVNPTGTYIAKISSSTSANFGVTYVCGSRSEIGNLVSRCYDLNNWQNFLTTGLESLQKTVFDFSQYIQEIYWLPVSTGDIPNKGGTGQTFFIGAWELDGGTGNCQTFYGDNVSNLAVQLNTPNKYYNDFRDYSSQYTKFLLDIPAVGQINIDPKDVYSGLEIQYEIDLKTGDAKHVITANNNIISTIRCNYKTPVSYATFNNNFVAGANQIFSGISSMVSSVASKNAGGTAQAVTNMTEGLIAMENITSHQVSSQGTMGDIKTRADYSLTRYVHTCAGQPILNRGRKLNEYRQLSNLSGYCECENSKLDTNAFGEVKDAIINYMNSGFFIE